MKSFVWKHRIALLFCLFLLLRLLFLFRYPPFSDEATFVRWGQLMVQKPMFRWASLQYVSRQPLAFWLFGLGSLIFGTPFIGARLAALLVNTVSFFFLADWVKRIANEKVTMITLLLFAICPIFIFFQTLALMDGLVVTAMVILLWSLSRKNLVVTAIALALSLWIKSTGLIMALVTAGAIAYADRKRPFTALWRLGLCMGLTIILLLPLLVRPERTFLFAEPHVFTYSPLELLSFPFTVWMRNIGITLFALLLYIGPLYPVALFFSRSQLSRRHFFILLYWIATTSGIAILTGKLFTTRYVLISLIPLLPLLGSGIYELLVKKKRIIVILGLSLPVIFSGILILNARWFFSLFPDHTPVTQERNYAYYWTSGYAAADAVKYIRSTLATGSPVILAVADAPGSPSDYMLATFYTHRSLAVILLNSPGDLKNQASLIRSYPTYYIARRDTLPVFLLPYLTEVKKFPTPDGADFVGIYSVQIPQKDMFR